MDNIMFETSSLLDNFHSGFLHLQPSLACAASCNSNFNNAFYLSLNLASECMHFLS